ncbi:hypothetical protein [Streptomyces californicus]|uniref:hypothetical protein n=1 Tax=Streptomyces californicus TaxID=67351 RepID=UPI003720239A
MIAFTPREAQLVTLLSEGLTVAGVDDRLGTTMASRHLAGAKAKICVTSVRSLVYVSIAEGRIARPAPAAGDQQLGELEELVWAGLRCDVPDQQLARVLAPLARTTPDRVREVVDELTGRYRTTTWGLIARGYALGLLSGREGTHLPTYVPAATRPQLAVTRRGPWQLTGRQGQALALLPLTRSDAEAAARAGVGPDTQRRHIRAVRTIAGVRTDRALVHRAYQAGVLRPPPIALHQRPSPEVAAVWRGLVLDVPDRELDIEIAAATGLSGNTVRRILDELRADGESDGQLVARGWAYGVITARDDDGRLRTSARGPAAGRRPAGAPRQPAPVFDPLRLLPVTAPAASRSWPQSSGIPSVCRIGRDCDLVRVTPDVCRDLLARLPAARWGPVVGRAESRTALLVAPPAVLPDGWRATSGRLWRRGGSVELPPEDRPTPDGSYWATSPHAPRWDPAHLDDLLNTLPPAAAHHR